MFRTTPRHAQAKKNKNKLQSIALPTELVSVMKKMVNKGLEPLTLALLAPCSTD